jgi:hypothetical protein
MADPKTRTEIRLPTELYERLHEAAKAWGRSFNGEMVKRLGDSFDDRQDMESIRLQSEVKVLKAALQAAHMAMENQNRLINVLTVQPTADQVTPEYVEMHRKLVASGAWESMWAEMRELSKSLKKALDFVQ